MELKKAFDPPRKGYDYRCTNPDCGCNEDAI
jgi:hypothetical protein